MECNGEENFKTTLCQPSDVINVKIQVQSIHMTCLKFCFSFVLEPQVEAEFLNSLSQNLQFLCLNFHL